MQQYADKNIIQFHFILKCTKDQSSHFCDCFLVSKWIFQHHDRGLTKFHAGSEKPLVCVVIINFIYPTVKNKNTAYHAFGKYWMKSRGFSKVSFKILLPEGYLLYVYQTNLNGKLRKNWGAKQKSGGAWPTQPPPHRIATGYSPSQTCVKCFTCRLMCADTTKYAHFLIWKGIFDWKQTLERLRSREHSVEHIDDTITFSRRCN